MLTFGLITPYMVLPIGFGGIFLNNILLKNLNDNGLHVSASQVPTAMLLPGLGMLFGLLLALFLATASHDAITRGVFYRPNRSINASTYVPSGLPCWRSSPRSAYSWRQTPSYSVP